MSNLETHLCGIRFANPILTAAGPPVWNGKAMLRCARGGAGGLVAKTISVSAAHPPRPNMAEVKGSLLNAETWSELPPEQFLDRELPLARQAGVPLIVSLGYTTADIASLAPRVRAYADALELSTHYTGDDPGLIADVVRAAKDGAGLPVWVKLSPFRDVQRAAEAAARAGADAIVAVNSFGPCLALDPETGRPLLGSELGYGWLSGKALKPLALRCVFDIVRAVDLPVIGVGGVAAGEDAVEMFMVGASAVQVCTAAILRGPQVFGRIARELGQWLDAHGYTSPEEIRGLTHRRLRESHPKSACGRPHLFPSECTACGACVTSCMVEAIHVDERGLWLDEARCAGCGLCITRCPVGALGREG